MKNFANNPNVQNLAETMDLELPKHYLAISDYGLENGKLVIREVEVLNDKAEFIRHADIKKLVGHLHEYPIAFRKL